MVAATDLDAQRLFELLTDPCAVELRHKVGVAGRADGSGKPSTRLLSTGGWLLKTSVAAPTGSRAALHGALLDEIERGLRAAVWHPTKQWAILETPGGLLRLIACRELRTLRSLPSLAARTAAWTRMLSLGLDVERRAGLALDLNPANFGEDPGLPGLFYLDDELYGPAGLRGLSLAIAARIPEEPEATLETWRAWGDELREALTLTPVERASLVDAVRDYPLAEAYYAARDALTSALLASAAPSRGDLPLARSHHDLTCVFADVHANLPALHAVVTAARDAGATSFLFLGDAVGYGPHPRECVDFLAELDPVRVAGNHDHAIATGRFELGMNRLARLCAAWTRDALGPAQLAWLESLPREHAGERWLAVHGAPRDPARFLAYVYDLTFEENLRHIEAQGVDLCFHGHSHVQGSHATRALGPAKLTARDVTPSSRQPHLVNPGSVGQPRDGDPRAAYAMWDRASGRITFERAGYPIDATLRDLRRAGLPEELGTRLERGI